MCASHLVAGVGEVQHVAEVVGVAVLEDEPLRRRSGGGAL